MGHHGQLARSQDMGAPITKGPDGKDTYELGKRWIGTEVEAEEKDEKTGKIEKFTVFKYFGGLIAEKFLKPAPPRWTIPGKKDVISVAVTSFSCSCLSFSSLLLLASRSLSRRSTIS